MFVVSFDALAQASDFRIKRRQIVFLCWMQDSKLGSFRHQFASTPNAYSQTHWAIEDQAKTLNSTAHPYDEWAFSPLDFTADWLSHLALTIYITIEFEATEWMLNSEIHTRTRKKHASLLSPSRGGNQVIIRFRGAKHVHMCVCSVWCLTQDSFHYKWKHCLVTTWIWNYLLWLNCVGHGTSRKIYLTESDIPGTCSPRDILCSATVRHRCVQQMRL